MTVPTTHLPSLGQWRLINLLAMHKAFTARLRASRALDKTDCRASDLGELAEDGWVTGHNVNNDDVDLAENWNHSLAHVFLRLSGKGLAWATGNPHNNLLFEVADAQGAYRMKPAEVKEQYEVIAQLTDRMLISAETESGAPMPPVLSFGNARTAAIEPLYIRLTERGRSIVSP